MGRGLAFRQVRFERPERESGRPPCGRVARLARRRLELHARDASFGFPRLSRWSQLERRISDRVRPVALSHTGTANGKEVTFMTGELLDMVTNGMIFHEDPRHRQAVEMFAREPRWSYL